MKKLIILIAAAIFTLGAFAQDDSEKKMHKMDHKMKDCVMMKDGKIIMMKNGKTMAMDKEMTLGNGTKVMPDGKLVMKDGTTKMMKDDETVYLDGKMGKMHMHNDMPKKREEK